MTETNGSGINLGWDKLDAAVAVSCGQGAGKQWTFRCAGEESLIYMRANQFPHQKGHFFLRALPVPVMSSTQRSSLGCLQVISDTLDEQQHWSAFHYLDVRNFLYTPTQPMYDFRFSSLAGRLFKAESGLCSEVSSERRLHSDQKCWQQHL